jgi:hypothetical protein
MTCSLRLSDGMVGFWEGRSCQVSYIPVYWMREILRGFRAWRWLGEVEVEKRILHCAAHKCVNRFGRNDGLFFEGGEQ